MSGTIRRLQENWVYGGALSGVVLLALAPLLTAGWTLGERLVFLALPVYMLHQLEEHDGDRFRAFVNEVIGKGREVLSVPTVFIVNVAGVWGVMVLAIWLMRGIASGWGLIGVYLLLVNAVLHVVQGVALRRSNPGLWTAVLLFLPLGIWAFAQIAATAGAVHHAVSLVVVLALHGAIVATVWRRLAAS